MYHSNVPNSLAISPYGKILSNSVWETGQLLNGLKCFDIWGWGRYLPCNLYGHGCNVKILAIPNLQRSIRKTALFKDIKTVLFQDSFLKHLRQYTQRLNYDFIAFIGKICGFSNIIYQYNTAYYIYLMDITLTKIYQVEFSPPRLRHFANQNYEGCSDLNIKASDVAPIFDGLIADCIMYGEAVWFESILSKKP